MMLEMLTRAPGQPGGRGRPRHRDHPGPGSSGPATIVLRDGRQAAPHHRKLWPQQGPKIVAITVGE
ncbi:MAG: hypothetical protein WBN94_06340 [Methanothrix sp.]